MAMAGVAAMPLALGSCSRGGLMVLVVVSMALVGSPWARAGAVKIPASKSNGAREGMGRELAARSGVSVKTIRFYCDQGLLQPSGRSEGRYRIFDKSG